MSLVTQAKLLRVLQEGVVTPVGSSEPRKVDVRILSATSKHLPEEIGRGTFREDLYHRINVLTIAVPPLRARREDIPELAAHFLRLASLENGVKPKTLSRARHGHPHAAHLEGKRARAAEPDGARRDPGAERQRCRAGPHGGAADGERSRRRPPAPSRSARRGRASSGSTS